MSPAFRKAPSARLLYGLVLLPALALLPWIQSLLDLRLPYQNDILIHLRWSDQFLSALRDGWLLPRWAAASFGGLGDPTFSYYQPLFYYLTSAYAALGIGSARALLWAALTPFVMLGLIIHFAILRDHDGRRALAGACFVVFCPVLFFLSAQMAAFPWTLSLPFSILFIKESTREQPRPIPIAVLVGVLCLSHLLSALIALLATGVSRLLLHIPTRHNLFRHASWLLGVFLGLGLAAFFVYPAVTQLFLINPIGWTEGANFDWRRSFAFPTVTFMQYGLRWPAIQWPFALLTLVLSLLVLLPRHARATRDAVLAHRFAIVALAALVLGSELAYPLYALLPPLQKIQFPYRFVFVAAILASTAFVLHLLDGGWSRWSRPLRSAALLAISGYAAMTLFLQWQLYRDGQRLPERSTFMQGIFGQPEYLPAVRGPEWKQYVVNGKLDGECRRLGIGCTESPANDTRAYAAVIDTPAPVSVRLPRFAYPAWQLTVDDIVQPLAVDPATGVVLVRLAPGRHTVALHWIGLPADVTGKRITWAALAILLALSILGALHKGSPASASRRDPAGD